MPRAASGGDDGPCPWPPILRAGLSVVFVGSNPGLRSLADGHRYAHPTNLFWALLADAGLTPGRLAPADDTRLPELGYGFTEVADRATAEATALTAGEWRDGRAKVRAQLARFVPRIAAYTAKAVYRAVAALPTGAPVHYGAQARSVVPPVIDFVLPSPSGRTSQPRAEKLAWYLELAALAANRAPAEGRHRPVRPRPAPRP